MSVIEYNVVATLQIRSEELTDPVVDNIVDSVALYHGTVSPSVLGHAELVFTINAESFAQATDLALSVLYHSVDYDLRALEILPTEDYDLIVEVTPSAATPVNAPKPPEPPKAVPEVEEPELVSLSNAAAELGISRQRMLQLVQAKAIPGRKVGNNWTVTREAVDAHRAAKGRE